MTETKLYIKDVAKKLNRREATIRGWERDKILPSDLVPLRDKNGWRYWTDEMVQNIQAWITSEDRRPGKGLPHYKPSADDIAKHIQAQRKKRV
jgi:hypothetical protein